MNHKFLLLFWLVATCRNIFSRKFGMMSTSKKSTAVTGFLQQIGPKRPLSTRPRLRGEFGLGTLLLGIALLGRLPFVDGDDKRGPNGRLVTDKVLRLVTATESMLGKLPTPFMCV